VLERLDGEIETVQFTLNNTRGARKSVEGLAFANAMRATLPLSPRLAARKRSTPASDLVDRN